MTTKKWLAISICLNVIIVSFFIIKRVAYSAATSFKSYSEQNDFQRKDIFSVLSIDTSDIVFVGNSITERAPLNELFENAINRGIGSNTTAQVLKRIDSVTKYNPRLIVLEIGINDISMGVPLDTVVNNIKLIAKHCSRIIVQSILPNERKLDLAIRQTNAKIKKYCDQSNVRYIDAYSSFVKNGEMNPEFSFDGTHLNGKGFLKWAGILNPYLPR